MSDYMQEAVEAAVRESDQHLLTFSDDQQRHIICTCGGEISETDTHRIRAILAAAEPYMRKKWEKELVERIESSDLGAPLHIDPDGTFHMANGPEMRAELCKFIMDFGAGVHARSDTRNR